MEKNRVIQEYVPGKQVTLAHLIAHPNKDICKKIGLKIVSMEEDEELQDAILTVHHAYMLSISGSDAVKIIENQNGKAVINHE